MNDKNEGLNERLAHRKRIQRMKTGLILFIVTWMLAWMLISVALIAKVNSLQDQIDIITKNTIRSQQVEQQENQVEKSGSISQADGKEKSEDAFLHRHYGRRDHRYHRRLPGYDERRCGR